MKKGLVIAISLACFATAGHAEWTAWENQSVRLDYVYAEDVGSEDAHGVEIAFGTELYEMDDVAVYFLYQDNDDMDAQQLGLSIQEHFPITSWTIGLEPYVGAGVGYGWLDVNDGREYIDADGGALVGRVEAGAVLRVCNFFAFNAGARYNVAANDIFLNGHGGAQSSQWTFVLGGRFYY